MVHKERFYCEHQVYDKNHLLHQTLKQGLLVLDGLGIHNLGDKIKRLQFYFEGIEQTKITEKQLQAIQVNRKSQPYQKALNIAKMLILNYSPNINSGNDNMLTLLFDMNKLWEEYIFRVLYKHQHLGYEISYQNSDTFWEHKRIKPDIVITMNNKNHVIDTKWKVVDSNNPSDADLKQLFVYNLHWNSSKSMLLYPQVDQIDSKFGNYKYFGEENSPNQCKLGFVSVLDNGKIKASEKLSVEILQKLM
tara:strand:- start:510 stop:1253 length:744 start_codon:yes stop_codon:yes gene_type:complete